MKTEEQANGEHAGALRKGRQDGDATLRARAAETTGLALIALVILAISLVRYWKVIHWSWR